MSIASEITRLQTAKADIKAAIEAQGVTVPSATLLSGYDDLIAAIQTGGGGEPDHWVRPSGWPNYDNVQLGTNDVIYMTYDTTDPDYSFISLGSTGSDGSTINVEIGTITNGAFTAIDTDSYAKNDGYYRYLYGEGYPDYVAVRITPESGKKITSVPPPKNEISTKRSGGGHQMCLEIYAHLHNLSSLMSPGFRYMYNVRSVYLDVKTANKGLSNSLSDMISLESAYVTSTDDMRVYCTFENDRNLKFVTLDMGIQGDCRNAFSNCKSIQTIDTSSWGDMSAVTNTANMFSGCTALRELDTSEWDLSSVTSLANMFNDCNNLRTLDTSGWDLSEVTDLSTAFQNCYNLTLSKSSIDGMAVTSKNTKIVSMFYNCRRIRELDLSEWNLSGVASAANTAAAFRYMDNLNSITLPSTLAYIGSNCIANATVLSEVHLLRTTPPTLAASSAIGGPSDLKIYVPYSADHSVLNAYKTATNWSSLSSKIYEEDAP